MSETVQYPEIIEIMRSLQQKNGTETRRPRHGDRIGFALSSKDRYLFTLQTVQALEEAGGFDLIWNDGSEEAGCRALAHNYRFRNVRLVEVNDDVRGGPDAAICFGLRRLLDLNYDYVGLVENDVILQPGWLPRLMDLFDLAASEGLACGAATVRNYESRVLEYRRHYTTNWAIGAGMALFSRSAAQLILNQYHALGMTTVSVRRFYAEVFGVDLDISEWSIWPREQPVQCTMDWGYTPLLYRHGYASVGSIPSLATDLEFEVRQFLRTNYVGIEKNNSGVPHPRCIARS